MNPFWRTFSLCMFVFGVSFLITGKYLSSALSFGLVAGAILVTK